MARLKRERERQDPAKQTEFILRGEPVPLEKVERFERSCDKKYLSRFNSEATELTDHSKFGRILVFYRTKTIDLVSIPDLICRTPPPSGKSIASPGNGPTTPPSLPPTEDVQAVSISAAGKETSGEVSALFKPPDNDVRTNLSGGIRSLDDVFFPLPCSDVDFLEDFHKRSPKLRPTSPFGNPSWLRAITPPPRSFSPSCSYFSWYPWFFEFSSSPHEARYTTAAKHELEEIIRRIGQEISNYEDQCALNSEVQYVFEACPESCRTCDRYGFQPSSRACGVVKLVARLYHKRNSRVIGQDTYDRLLSGAIYQLLPTTKATPELLSFLADYVFAFQVKKGRPESARRTYAALSAFSSQFLDTTAPQYRRTQVRIARAVVELGELEEPIRILRLILGDAFGNLSLLCDRMSTDTIDFEGAVKAVTEGRIEVELSGNGSYRSRSHEGSLTAPQWSLKVDGALNSTEIYNRAIALQTLTEVRQQRKKSMFVE